MNMNSFSEEQLQLSVGECLLAGAVFLALTGIFIVGAIILITTVTVSTFVGVLLASTLLIGFVLNGMHHANEDSYKRLSWAFKIPLILAACAAIATGVVAPVLGLAVLIFGMPLAPFAINICIAHLIAVTLVLAIVTVIYLKPAIIDSYNIIRNEHENNKEIDRQIEEYPGIKKRDIKQMRLDKNYVSLDDQGKSGDISGKVNDNNTDEKTPDIKPN